MTSTRQAETFTLHLVRLTLIDTAEESEQWALRARAQWGGRHPLAIRVTSGGVVCGTTAAREMVFDTSRGWSGVSWRDGNDEDDVHHHHHHHHDNDNDNNDDGQQHHDLHHHKSAAGIDVPLTCNPVLLLEAVSVRTHALRHHNTASSSSSSSSTEERVMGVGVLSAQAMLCESRQFAQFCVHLLPTHAAIDSDTVHAVAEVELHSSLLDERPESNYTALEYNYGAVRVSSVDFYYPPFLLTGTGAYIVSNVLCAMNMTESSALAMQLVPLGMARRYIVAEPHQIITVRPQQRVYFSATWALTQRAVMCKMELQLKVNGLQSVSAPIRVKVHVGVPQPTTMDIPYHYWVNTTRVTNRATRGAHELPRICAILPIHRLVADGATTTSSRTAAAAAGVGHAAHDTDKALVGVRGQGGGQASSGYHYNNSSSSSNIDVAALVASATTTMGVGRDGVADNGDDGDAGDDEDAVAVMAAAAVAAAAAAATTSTATAAVAAAMTSQLDAEEALMLRNASFVVQQPRANYGGFVPRGPLLDLYQKTCMCTITLGTIRGFPIVFESVTGVSPSFQVSVTLLDQRGWHVLRGETLPSYQSASGSLRWAERLVLRKWPGAQSTQFVRLNLTEVRARDGDETPIGACLISLPSMHCICARNTLSVAFYVYETYSLYDQLTSPSLLMKGVTVTFSKVR